MFAGCEPGVGLADILAEALKLPTANGTALSKARKDKAEMQEQLRRCGVDSDILLDDTFFVFDQSINQKETSIFLISLQSELLASLLFCDAFSITRRILISRFFLSKSF